MCTCRAAWLSTLYSRKVDRAHWRTQDLKKGGVVVEGDHPKGEGAGGGVPPPARSAEAFENVNSVC